MKISKEQKLVIDTAKKENIINVNSLAGTGKTTLLENVAHNFEDKSILYIVFNKKNQLEAQERFPRNTITKTINGFAFSHIARQTNINMNFNNIVNYKAKEISEIYKVDYGTAISSLELFDNYCVSDEIEFPTTKTVAKRMFNDMINGKIKITHNFYVKYFHLLLEKGVIKISYDMGLLDESQDTNRVTLEIFNLINFKKRIYVGDKNQRIYSFRGSQDIFHLTNGIELHLTESFRCHKKIVKKANLVLSKFKGTENLLRTNIKEKGKIKTKAFISRTNSELIKKINDMMEDDKSFKTIRSPHILF